jgi:hypothetical protein
METSPAILFAQQNSHGFRLKQKGRSTYVYGTFYPNGSVWLSVFIDGDMVWSEVIKPESQGTRRRKRRA